jgi:hypothetical protein
MVPVPAGGDPSGRPLPVVVVHPELIARKMMTAASIRLQDGRVMKSTYVQEYNNYLPAGVVPDFV